MKPRRPELGVSAEPRRQGEVSLGVVGDDSKGFAWATVADARDYAFAILKACRAAEDGDRYGWVDGEETPWSDEVRRSTDTEATS